MNRKLLERIKYSPVSRLATMPHRVRAAVPSVAKGGLHALRWILRSREISDPGYDYEPIGILSLAVAASLMTGVPAATARGYAAELTADRDFADRYLRRVRGTRLKHTLDPRHAADRKVLGVFRTAVVQPGPGVRELTPTLAVMTFLVASGKGDADAAELTDMVQALCRQLPQLRAGGHPKWRELQPSLKIDTGWPVLASAQSALARCAR